jgi:acetate kinase
VDALAEHNPGIPQVGCFDTDFHRSLPPVAALLAIPRRFHALGIRRYGFHGISYTGLMHELERSRDPNAAHGAVILAHLGGGSSLAAVRDGVGIDTSMGFTPASGLPMGTRSGDLDPGLAGFLARTEGMTPAGFDRMVHEESGLLGLSGTGSDMRDLLSLEPADPHAREAVDLYCYQTMKAIGAFAAALGGWTRSCSPGESGSTARPCGAGSAVGWPSSASRWTPHATPRTHRCSPWRPATCGCFGFPRTKPGPSPGCRWGSLDSTGVRQGSRNASRDIH